MKFRRMTAIACAVAAGFGISTSSALTIDEQFNGFFVETDGVGNRGLNLELLELAPELYAAFVTGFTYAPDGNQVFFTGIDTNVVPGDVTLEFDLREPTGGVPFGDGFVTPNQAVIGTGTLTVNTCNDLSLSVTSTSANIPDFNDISFDRGTAASGFAPAGPDECAYQEAFNGCPAFSDGPFSPGGQAIPRACELSGTFTQDIELTNDILWVLTGTVFIGEPAEVNNTNRVTIEPGTRIVSVPGGSAEAFSISRGAQIVAVGTPFAPIVFSSGNPTSALGGGATASQGEFGGLVINGLAPVNNCPEPPGGCTSEGLAGTLYGGLDPFDSSGIIKYLRVQFGGDDITPENQLNGIAFQGVGAGTTVDYIQVHANDDDGIEWFGGTVRVTHAVVTGVSDDSLDWVNGWQGSLQYAVVDQQGVGDQGIEADNFEDDNLESPRSLPVLANLTLDGDASTDIGMLFREGTGVNLTNSIVKGFGDGCLDIDDDGTFTQSFNSDGSPNGTLTIQNTFFACSTPFIEEAGDPVDISDFVSSFDADNTVFAGFDGVFPPSGAGFLSGLTMDPQFFSSLDLVDYAGAFASSESAWTAGWTIFLNQ